MGSALYVVMAAVSAGLALMWVDIARCRTTSLDAVEEHVPRAIISALAFSFVTVVLLLRALGVGHG